MLLKKSTGSASDFYLIKSLKSRIVLLSESTGGFSSAGRAPALQAGGRRFDPVNLHQAIKPKSTSAESKTESQDLGLVV